VWNDLNEQKKAKERMGIAWQRVNLIYLCCVMPLSGKESLLVHANLLHKDLTNFGFQNLLSPAITMFHTISFSSFHFTFPCSFNLLSSI